MSISGRIARKENLCDKNASDPSIAEVNDRIGENTE